MSWRPEGFQNEYAKAANEARASTPFIETPYGKHILNFNTYQLLLKLEHDSEVFEAGADAMHKADVEFLRTKYPELYFQIQASMTKEEFLSWARE